MSASGSVDERLSRMRAEAAAIRAGGGPGGAPGGALGGGLGGANPRAARVRAAIESTGAHAAVNGAAGKRFKAAALRKTAGGAAGGAAAGIAAVGRGAATGAALAGRATIVGIIHTARKRPNRRQLIFTALIGAILLSAAWLLVRNSSLVEVREVRVVGLDGYYDRAARRAVTTEARDMTTMNVDGDRLKAAAGEYVNVADLHVKRDYPHGLTVVLDVRHPVAAAKIGASIYAVTGDGQVLNGAKSLSVLPNIEVGGVVKDGRVTDAKALASLKVLGAAPDVLLRRVKSLKWGRLGMMFVLDKGVRLTFGNAKDAAAKWHAVAAVLANPAAKGAHYIDLRVPERPAIGGLGAAPLTVKPLNEASSLPADPTGAGAGAGGATGSTGAASVPQSGGETAPTGRPVPTGPPTGQ